MISNETTTRQNDTRPLIADWRASERLSVRLVDADQREAVLEQWRELADRLEHRGLADSWLWTKVWLEHYGDLVPHRFAVGEQGGTVHGVCLVTEGVDQRRGPFPVRSLHLGTAGEPEHESVCVEYNRLLIDPRFRHAFVAGLWDVLRDDDGWDELNLDGFCQADFELFVQGFADEWEVRETASHYYDLAAARAVTDEAISQFGYATRKNLRKNLKRYGHLESEWAETAEQGAAIFADLVRLHQQRWEQAGHPGSYASERFTGFHEALLPTMIADGRLGLFRVKSDGEVLGCVQVFIDCNRVLCYQAGSTEYTGNRLSPGVLVDYLCIEECLRRGYDAYDFLGGNTHHKQKLSTDQSSLYWAVYRRPRWKYVALDSLRAVKRHLQQLRNEC